MKWSTTQAKCPKLEQTPLPKIIRQKEKGSLKRLVARVHISKVSFVTKMASNILDSKMKADSFM